MALAKSDLIVAIMQCQSGLSQKAASQIVDIIWFMIAEELAQTGTCKIPGFGTFRLTKRQSAEVHDFRNPGKKIKTNPKLSVGFRPGKSLKERINQ